MSSAGVVVIKVGGDVVADPSRRALFVDELGRLHASARRVVVLHGGGPQATALTRRLGLVPNVVGGRRITSPEVLDVMKMTLAGSVSVDLTAACRGAGLPALGVAGVSAGLIRARRRPPRVVSGCGDEPVDFGEVGDVVGVDAAAIGRLLDAGFLPVLSSLSADDSGRVLNINADIVACSAAIGLRAVALVLLTGANGVMRALDDPTTRYPRLSVDEARGLIVDGTVQGGMIPKLEEAFRVLATGVGEVCILPGGVEGAITGALAGSDRWGTVLVA